MPRIIHTPVIPAAFPSRDPFPV